MESDKPVKSLMKMYRPARETKHYPLTVIYLD